MSGDYLMTRTMNDYTDPARTVQNTHYYVHIILFLFNEIEFVLKDTFSTVLTEWLNRCPILH